MEEYMSQIRANIKKYRKLQKYKQKDVADAIGLSDKYYQTLESGPKPFTLDNIIAVCKFLRITLNDLIDIDATIPNEELAEKCRADINDILDKLDLEKLYRVLQFAAVMNE